MAPNGQTMVGSYTKPNTPQRKPPARLSMDGLQRTISDVSQELSKEGNKDLDLIIKLPPISEVEDTKCECCGLPEECTPEYISRVREKFSGKMICGLCSEAVKEEMEKNGGGKSREEALNKHIDACVRFNRFGRAYPVLFQAEAVREILKKSRAKSLSPRDNNNNNNNSNNKGISNGQKKGGIARSSSCIPAISKDI